MSTLNSSNLLFLPQNPVITIETTLLKLFNTAEIWTSYILIPFIFIFGGFGNSLTLAFHLSNKKQYNLSLILLVIYSILSIYMCCFVVAFIPIIRFASLNLIFNYVEKKILWFHFAGSMTFFSCSTLFSIMMIASLLGVITFDRFINVYFPLTKDHLFFKVSTVILLLGLTTLSVVTGYEYKDPCLARCFAVWSMSVVFGISILFQMILYSLIGYKLVRNRKNIVKVEPSTNATTDANINPIKANEERKKMLSNRAISGRNAKIIKSMIVTSLLSAITFAPTIIFLMKILYTESLVIYFIIFCNSIWNPIAFYVFNPIYRKYVKKILSKMIPCYK